MSCESTSTYVNELVFMVETGLYRAMRMVVHERIWLGTDIPCPLTACVVLGQLLEQWRACFCLTTEWVDFRNRLMVLTVWHCFVCEELSLLSCRRRCSICLDFQYNGLYHTWTFHQGGLQREEKGVVLLRDYVHCRGRFWSPGVYVWNQEPGAYERGLVTSFVFGQKKFRGSWIVLHLLYLLSWCFSPQQSHQWLGAVSAHTSTQLANTPDDV